MLVSCGCRFFHFFLSFPQERCCDGGWAFKWRGVVVVVSKGVWGTYLIPSRRLRSNVARRCVTHVGLLCSELGRPPIDTPLLFCKPAQQNSPPAQNLGILRLARPPVVSEWRLLHQGERWSPLPSATAKGEATKLPNHRTPPLDQQTSAAKTISCPQPWHFEATTSPCAIGMAMLHQGDRWSLCRPRKLGSHLHTGQMKTFAAAGGPCARFVVACFLRLHECLCTPVLS